MPGASRVLVLNAADGAIRRTYANVPAPEEMLLSGGALYTVGGGEMVAFPVDSVNADPAAAWPMKFGDTQRTNYMRRTRNTTAITLAVDAVRPATVYAGVANETLGGVFRSDDEGASWTRRSEGLTGLGTTGTFVGVSRRLKVGTTTDTERRSTASCRRSVLLDALTGRVSCHDPWPWRTEPCAASRGRCCHTA